MPRAIGIALHSLVLFATLLQVAGAGEAETLAKLNAALPNDWIAVAVVANPSQNLADHAELIEPFDLGLREQAQQVVAAIDGLDGIDAAGNFAVGLCQTNDKQIQSFILLPTPAPDELIESLEGDPKLKRPSLNFGGEPLVAMRRDGWLALGSEAVADQFAKQNTSPLPKMGDTLTCAIEPSAWERLAITAAAMREADRRWYERARRVLAPGGKLPRNMNGLTDLLLAAKPMVDHLAETSTAVSVALDAKGQKPRLTVELTLRGQTAPLVDEASAVAPPGLESEAETIAETQLALPSTWLRWGLKNSLIAQQVWSEEAIMQMDRSKFYGDYITACDAVAAQIGALTYVIKLHVGEHPPMANQVAIIDCDETTTLTTNIEKAVEIWNAMVTKEMSRSRLTFEKSEVEIDGVAAIRYSVDLQAAFLAADVPDVKVLMTKMFGNDGWLSYTLVPIDNRRLLVSMLPDVETVKILRKAKKSAIDLAQGSMLAVEFSPQNYRRWQAQQYAIEFADAKFGPTVTPIKSEDRLTITATGDARRLTLTATASRELLHEWIGSQAKRADN